MLRSIKEVQGYKIHASDGPIGSVEQFFFDDQTWMIRYAVVNTGSWLLGREVLITPSAFLQPNWNDRSFPLKLMKDQIRNSPQIDTQKPISRQQELKLHNSFGWIPYWENAAPGAIPAPAQISTAVQEIQDEELNSHLRSTKEVFGYNIQARDGEIGHLEDFIFDDEIWMIRYAVVDTRKWLPGRKVLLSKDWIDAINWSNKNIHMDLSQKSIESSPEFDPAAPVNRTYEERMYDYYGRPAYWR